MADAAVAAMHNITSHPRDVNFFVPAAAWAMLQAVTERPGKL